MPKCSHFIVLLGLSRYLLSIHAVLVSMRDLEMTGSYESGLLLFVAEMSKHLKGTNMFPGTVLSVVSLSVWARCVTDYFQMIQKMTDDCFLIHHMGFSGSVIHLHLNERDVITQQKSGFVLYFQDYCKFSRDDDSSSHYVSRFPQFADWLSLKLGGTDESQWMFVTPFTPAINRQSVSARLIRTR